MPETTCTVEALANLITSRVPCSSFHIIGIDGTDGSGKSTLARQLASRLGAVVVELDCLVEKNGGGYVDFVDYSALTAKIRTYEDQSALLIIEGICLLAVLERATARPSLLIYAKRINNFGHWYDSYFCEPHENQTIANRELLRRFAPIDDETSAEEDTLLLEIARYHQSYKPTQKADAFFERVVDD